MIYLVQNKTQTKFAYDYLKSEPVLGADTETTGLDPFTSKILLIQLGTPEYQFVFDIAKIPNTSLKLIFNILEAENIQKVFQNGKFDYKMLKQNYNVIIKNMADTMITEQLLTKGIKKRGFGLAELTKKYRVGELNKEIRKGFETKKFGDTFTQEEIEYAAEDVRVTPLIYEQQLKIATKINNMLDLINLENRTVSVVADMELNGIYINKNLWKQLEKSALSGQKIAEEKLQKHFEPYYPINLFGKLDINYNSPIQIKPALEKVIGKSLENTNEKYLMGFDEPVIDDLLEYREKTKLISTYGSEFLKHIHPVTNRIHSKYLQLGTDSGRMSCTDPNMQQIPHQQEYRTPFCAQSNDYKIISADFASQELRVLAQLSKEQAWIDAINDGRDLHSMVASMMFGLPESECTKEKDKYNGYRTKAKTIGFGTIYGLSAHGLAKQLKISKKEAQKLLDQFFEAFPNIKKFLKERELFTATHKQAVSPLDGRIRDLGGIDWQDWRKRGHALNIGKNHPIQGASASITKLALVLIYEHIINNDLQAKIVGTVHDEILVECHKSIVNEVSDLIKNKMIEAFNHYCPDIPMEVIPDIGNHWIH